MTTAFAVVIFLFSLLSLHPTGYRLLRKCRLPLLFSACTNAYLLCRRGDHWSPVKLPLMTKGSCHFACTGKMTEGIWNSQTRQHLPPTMSLRGRSTPVAIRSYPHRERRNPLCSPVQTHLYCTAGTPCVRHFPHLRRMGVSGDGRLGKKPFP